MTEASRIGILVDSACDLPADFVREHGIQIAPITVRIGDRFLKDARDRWSTESFFGNELGWDSTDAAETLPTTVEEFQDIILGQMALDYDVIYVLTISATRSDIFRNARVACASLAQQAVNRRYAKGIKSLLQVKVVDSRNLFAGQGVQAARLVELIREHGTPNAIDPALERAISRTVGFMVPDDLKYLYTRAKRKNDRSVGFMSYTLGSMLDVKPVIRAFNGETEAWAKVRSYDAAIERVAEVIGDSAEAGTIEPIVNVGYGGPGETLEKIAPYQALRERLAARDVKVLESHMSLTAGINVGRGALAFGVIMR